VNLKKTLIKLTLGYLLLMMLVSGILSLILYEVGTQPLRRRLHLNERIIEEGFMSVDGIPPQIESLAVQEVQHRIALFLIYFNGAVLCFGGLLSYGLARRELKPLEAAMELQGRFTSDAAHELRTPLTAMRAEIEVALRSGELDTSEARELLESNLEEIGKLEALSTSLLKLAQYEEGERSKLGPVDLKEVVSDAVERVSREATSRDITIETRLESLPVSGERSHLVELFVILLDNSIKYSDDNRRISLSAARDKRYAVVTVTDEGYGISAQDLEHVFDRFYRGKFPSTVKQARGYGLGLSIARRIAGIYHGTIEMESEPGEGTTAIVRLPVARTTAHGGPARRAAGAGGLAGARAEGAPGAPEVPGRGGALPGADRVGGDIPTTGT
jgi:signal transduction histidine kinase